MPFSRACASARPCLLRRLEPVSGSLPKDLVHDDAFPRIKLGVGKKPTPEYDLADWVLSKMSEAEYNTLLETAERAAKALPLLIDGRIEEAMNRYSR